MRYLISFKRKERSNFRKIPPFEGLIVANGHHIKGISRIWKKRAQRNSGYGRISRSNMGTPDIQAARAMAVQFHMFNTRELHKREKSILNRA